jgi:hypothetical protein
MLNFEFHNPTRIVFGQGKVADLARLVPRRPGCWCCTAARARGAPERWTKCAPHWASAA